ncbi:alpha-galactosidase [Treponema sp. OttesenSCG-928-L16]|nr:alpha-galactosidase [Treponema sp. OttesenSCG-928-L16]
MVMVGISRKEAPMDLCKNGMEIIYSIDPKLGDGFSVPEGDFCVPLDFFSFEEILEKIHISGEIKKKFTNTESLTILPGGWLSWSAGWELADNEKLPSKVRFLPELIKLTNRPGDESGSDNKEITGHFIMYIRSGTYYLCIASLEGGLLPPISYRINRRERTVTFEAYAPGKKWKAGERLAKIYIFLADGFFPLKDIIKAIFQQNDAFSSINFLRYSGKADGSVKAGTNLPSHANLVGFKKSSVPGGYESWYNHYNTIDEKIILEDLEALGTSNNLIKLWYIERQRPVIFQIDDGWENVVGEWEVNTQRFPRGLEFISQKIEEKGYIPGLWLAPFIATRRCSIFNNRPEWLLKDKNGDLVVAGFNHLWDKQYYCLDISRDDVLEYFTVLMDRVIDDWGFRYIKLDFLYTGFFPGAFTQGGVSYEHYERACRILTSRTKNNRGLPVAYLGCGLPFGPSYKLFPLSRIGADTREMWDWNSAKMIGHVGRPSAYISLMDTIGRSFMDGTIYINDPDVIFLRSKNCRLKTHEKELIALVNFLLGGQIMFSDDPVHLDEADMALTRRVIELYDALSDDEYGAARIDRDVFALESRSGKVWGLINLRNKVYTLNGDRANKFQEGVFLTDHRIQGKNVFKPHTITLVRTH